MEAKWKQKGSKTKAEPERTKIKDRTNGLNQQSAQKSEYASVCGGKSAQEQQKRKFQVSRILQF